MVGALFSCSLLPGNCLLLPRSLPYEPVHKPSHPVCNGLPLLIRAPHSFSPLRLFSLGNHKSALYTCESGILFSSAQFLSHVWLFASPGTTPRQTSPTPGACSNSCHWLHVATQPSHPLLPSSPPAFSLTQHQGLFQWISSSHQVAKVLELQHQSIQWLFRTESGISRGKLLHIWWAKTSSYRLAQGSIFNILWQNIMEKNMKKSICFHILFHYVLSYMSHFVVQKKLTHFVNQL